MKIGSLDSKPAVSPLTSDGKAARASTDKSGAAATEDSAKVAISAEGQQIAQTASDPTFDSAKVERIAQAIRDGNFKVNPEKIADKLISNSQDLLKRYSTR